MSRKILVIEDDQGLAQVLRWQLEEEGYQVLVASDGVEGLRLAQEEQPQLVLLDLMLPRMTGWEACRRLRECSDVPIIMLTALASNLDKVRGLDLGADDYVTKPFSQTELMARARAALRRQRQPLQEEWMIQIDGRLTLDRARCRAVVEGQHVELSPIEFKLLSCLVDNAGRILTHQSLLTQVWGWEYAEEIDYLKVYVCSLRKKIEPDPRRPSYILTERGLGYRFQSPS